MHRRTASISWLVGILFWLSFSSVAAEAWFEFEKSFEVHSAIELDISMTAGDVYITRSDGNRLIIEGIKRVWGRDFEDAKRFANLIDIDIQHAENQFVIMTNYLPLSPEDKSLLGNKFADGAAHYGNVDYRITAPAYAKIVINAKEASVEVAGIDGDVIINNGNGRIMLSSIVGDVSIENADGRIEIESLFGSLIIKQNSEDIQLANIEGSINIESKSGKTLGEFLIGDIILDQDKGEVDLKWVEGDIRLKSLSANIHIRQLQGAIDLENKDGNVTIQTELNSQRDSFVRTGSGTIQFSIPVKSSGKLKIETKSGAFSTEIPISVETMTTNKLLGVLGDGGAQIELRSNSGDVTLAEF